MKRVITSAVLALLALTASGGGGPRRPASALPARPLSLIVQGESAASAAAAVRAVGGEVRQELRIINSVEAELTWPQMVRLRAQGGVRSVFPNRGTKVAGFAIIPESAVPAAVNVDVMQGRGTRGAGVTVALLDSGLGYSDDLVNDGNGVPRILARYDATLTDPSANDENGHGSHVASVLAGSRRSFTGKFLSVAPDARLVVVKAFGADGAGTYASVIRGLDWIVQNREQYGIRIVNCAFSAPPRSHYWQDPLAQAVMRTWQAGIVVVTAAGNFGPNPQTIGVPGNVPYVITVGAMTDRSTPTFAADDRMASFSAAGPTYEGFVKPEIVAPGGHVPGTMRALQGLAALHLESRGGADLFTMSSTSQAAAVVSGVATLLLQGNPTLTPDELKCRLMATARPAVDSEFNRAYSIFQQGAGLVDGAAANASEATACANRGLNVAADLSGSAHFAGLGNRVHGGNNYYLAGRTGSGYTWNGTFDAGESSSFTGYPWGDEAIWSEASPWTASFDWDGYPWPDLTGYPWPDDPAWTVDMSETISINRWVPQE